MKVSPNRKSNRASSCFDLRTVKSSNFDSMDVAKPNKTDLFNGIYKGVNISEQLSLKRLNKTQSNSIPIQLQNLIKSKIKNSPRSTKTVEQLLQQSKQLKMMINQLKKQISKLKIDLNLANKRYQQANSAIINDIDYYNDVYWAKDIKNYRITGMKLQYQKLKKQYTKQTTELNQTKLQLITSKKPELVAYIKQLQAQNKRIIKIIQSKPSKEDKNIQNAKILKNFKQNLKFEQLKSKIDQCHKNLKQKDAKIVFLQKMIIQKDNKQNLLSRRQRKLQKIIEDQNKDFYYHKQHINYLRKKQDIERIREKSRFEEQLRVEKKNWKKVLKQKQNKINQLQQNIKHLQLNANKNKYNPSMLLSKQNLMIHSGRKLSTQFGNNYMISDEQQLKSETKRISSQLNEQNMFLDYIAHYSQIPRSPRRATEKTTQKGVKLRKIQLKDVKQIADLLKYRMMTLGITPNQMKQFFSFKQHLTNEKKIDNSNKMQRIRSSAKSQQIPNYIQQQINRQQNIYISMKQTQQILREFPFSLQNQQSFALARYLIEDDTNDFVICDESNQNRRQIVKSIIKALLGEYQIISRPQITKFMQVFIKKYGSNLKSALQTYQQSGRVSKQKFIQILKSIGSQASESQIQMLTGKMSLSSNTMNTLNYYSLFKQL